MEILLGLAIGDGGGGESEVEILLGLSIGDGGGGGESRGDVRVRWKYR